LGILPQLFRRKSRQSRAFAQQRKLHVRCGGTSMCRKSQSLGSPGL
jgi:hypothetical protein